MATDVSFLYSTMQSAEEARTIGRALVTQRLVACVNIVERIGSLYWWEGKINEDSEAMLFAKTKTALVKDVITAIKSLHSYSCPCIVAVPITDGNEDFLSWVRRETR
ncbi:MAG TPA: divalent-cation tolerance protein CutA [Chitinivibrionales bacterium]